MYPIMTSSISIHRSRSVCKNYKDLHPAKISHYYFFSGKYEFSVLSSSLQSAIHSCPRRTSQFLGSEVTTRTAMLAYNTTNHEVYCHSACLAIWCCVWRTYYTGVYLVIYGCCSQLFCAIVATRVLASIISSKLL